MSDYPARSRGFLIGYTVLYLAFGGAAVATFYVWGPKRLAPVEEVAPAVTDQHWSGQP